MDPHYIGVNLPARQGVSNQNVVDAAIAQGYDLITSRITSASYRKRIQALYEQQQLNVPYPLNEDLVVFPGSHVSNTIALCAPWAELDSKDMKISLISYKVLCYEIEYAHFCGLPYVVVEGPKRRTYLSRYAHWLAKLLAKFPMIKIMVHTTFTEDFKNGVPPVDLLSTWEVWDGVRGLLNYPLNLGLALDLQRFQVPHFVLSRWLCEPIMMLVLGESSTFVPNAKGYPVLPKHAQHLVSKVSKLKPFFLIKDNLLPNKPFNFSGGDDACLIYLRNFLTPANFRHSQISRASRHVDAESVKSANLEFEMKHLSINLDDFEELKDTLQIPLQPLNLPLQSQQYEIFEIDVVKYNQYFKAVTLALQDLNASLQRGEALWIAVLGAGRGALVDRVLDAVVSSKVDQQRYVKVCAVEMHNGPISFLKARKASEPVWQHVEIVKCDIRQFKPMNKMHLVISELLGSFGDNELSPECLHEINERVLVNGGVMIPSEYSSYLAPLYAPKLWMDAKEKESPYVVNFRQTEIIDEPQLAWTFTHPTREPLNRECKLTFQTTLKSRVFGLAGYFSATLYKDITLSSLPETGTPNLRSWFPMYFPLLVPLEIVPESTIVVSMWRDCDSVKVWYEWAAETFFKRLKTGSSIIHNQGGDSFSIVK